MFQVTTINQKWQMTLPKKIRDLLSLKSPGKFLVEVVDSQEKTIRIKKKPSFLNLAGTLPAKNEKGEILNITKVREYIGENYKRA